MLNLHVQSGDYVTINGNIVIQVFRSGNQIQVSVQAPREIPVVRGKVLERSGHQRPEKLLPRASRCPSDQIHAARRFEKAVRRQEAEQTRAAALAEMKRLLGEMDDRDERVTALCAQLTRLEGGAQVYAGTQG